MIINKLILGHFGKFHNKEIDFLPGINIIHGKNEAGKSTLHTFIKGMFFGIEKGRGRTAKESAYDRYLPWETPGTYQGSMEFTYDNILYRISRSFYQKEKSFRMVRTDTGRQVLSQEDNLSQIFVNFTESNYANTISVRQTQAETDAELAKEVQNYIANLSTTKSSEVNVSEAITELTLKKKELDNKLKNNILSDIEERIEKCIQNEDRLDTLYAKKKEVECKIEELQKQHIIELNCSTLLKEEDMPKLYQMRGRAKDYKDTQKEIEELNQKKQKVREETELIDQIISKNACIREDYERLNQLQNEQILLTAEIKNSENHINELNTKYHKQRKNIMFSCIIFCIIFFTAIFLLQPVFSVLLIFAIIAFGISTYLLKKNKSLKQKTYMDDINCKESKLREICSISENILNMYQCNNISNMNDLCSKITEYKSKKAFLEERNSEISKDIDLKLTKSNELKEELSIYISDKIIFEGTLDFIDEIDSLIQKNEQEKKEKERKKLLFEEIYKKENEALNLLEKDIERYENSEDNLFELREQYNEEKEKAESLVRELEAVQLAISTIKGLSEEIHDSFGMEINRVLSKTTGEITLSAYNEVTADEKLSVKVFNGLNYVDLNKLSTGTIEQIYLALRLSVTKLFFGEEQMPIILDDSFAYYDDERLQAVLSLLYSSNRQVLLFTCQSREELLLKKALIPYNLINLE